MKKFDIQLYTQTENSQDCGPVSVRMILAYFGITKSENELKADMTYLGAGTYIYENGSKILRAGLQTVLITANPVLFPKDLQGTLNTRQSLLKLISKISKKLPNEKSGLNLFKNYIVDGGLVTIEIPEFTHIKDALDSNRLILALVHAQALGVNEGTGFHYVVLSGYKKNYVFVNNPVLGSRQGWFEIRDFMYALHSSTCSGIDNGSLLIVGLAK